MIWEDRYVIVAMDRENGDIYLSPETLRDNYTRDAAVALLEQLKHQLQPLNRVFLLMPFEKALYLWTQELLDDDPKKTERYIN